MLRVVVPNLPARIVAGKKDPSKSWQFQACDVYIVDGAGNPARHPLEHEIISEKGSDLYSPGEYTVAPSSVYKDQSGRLAFSLRLAPAKKVIS